VKRIFLFLATNMAIVLVLSVTMRLLGVEPYLNANGLNLTSLLIFAAVMGFGGSFISLAISKWSAKKSMGVRVIEAPANTTEFWLIETVRKYSTAAAIKMPEVGIFDTPQVNAFATGMSKNSSLVAVSSGLLQQMSKSEAEAVIGHEIAHVANGDMVTLALIQGVVNTFVMFLSRVIGQANALPLIFNTTMRLAIFLYGAWLIGEMRRVLLRESRMAREDALTQLPNRREFHERGLQALAQAQRQGASFTAAFIDLDRFKEVNDTLGHDIGDALLTVVARIIREQVRISDIPGRLGGDEFVLLLPNMDAQAASGYVEKLRNRLLDAMREKGWLVTFSIGVASYKVAPQDFDLLIKQADTLMYEVKHSGRDRVLQQEF
jgi:diguanylate cyclase (GGDEF)-like protein